MFKISGWILMSFLFICEAFAENKIALILGNQDYPDKKEKVNLFSKLDNPNNDAEDITKELKKFGFKHFDGSELKPLKNLNQTQIEEVINSFANSLKEGDIALFFYAGHGVAVEQNNYLIPVGRNFADGKDVKNYGIKTQLILDKITATGAKARIMILDACREHLAVTRGRGFDSAGFSNMNTSGAIVAYASALGQAALDGNGRNGLYTGHLLKVMREQPNQPFVNILMAAQTNTVHDKSNQQQQIPWLEIGMPNAQVFCLSTNGCQVSSSIVQEELDRLKAENEQLKNQLVQKPQPQNGISGMSGVSKEVKKEFTNSIGMEFVLIPASSFQMGDNNSQYNNEKPVHQVEIKQAFYLGKTEVTQKQYQAIMGNNPSHFKGENRPVEKVSWNDAQEFIKKLNEKEGTKKYRLPTEAEWEYAARAKTTTKWSFGDNENELENYAWYSKNSGKETHEVGQKKPNQFGLFDMHGNVWEWCEDTWHENYSGAPTDGSAWTQGDSTYRLLRGGCWSNSADCCSSAYRFHNSNRNHYYGFRVALLPIPQD